MTGCIKAYEHLALGGDNFDEQGLCVADLADLQKSTATHIDGFVGQDFLRTCSTVLTNYRAQVVEFEQ